MRFLPALLLALLLLALGLAGLRHRDWVPPGWDPLVPLDLQAPRTPLLPFKLALLDRDPGLCAAALATAPLHLRPARGEGSAACPLDRPVRVAGGPVPTMPGSFLASCRLAVAWSLFETDVAQPDAERIYGRPLGRIGHLGSFACRDVRGRAGTLSAHARADAIDVSGFVLDDGHTIPVTAWTKGGRDAAFLHAVRDGACRIFGIVLSPDDNEDHAGHLHLEAGGLGYCR